MDFFKYIPCLILTLIVFLHSNVSAQSYGGSSTTNVSEGRIIVNPGFFYRHDNRKQNDSSTVEITYLDLNLGYQFPNNWYLGILYSIEQERVISDNFPVDGIDSRYEYTRTSYALSGGYVYGSYYARAHYIFSNQWQVDENNTSVKYENGWGAQFDIGVNFELFSNFLLGPRLSYKRLVYRKQSGSLGTSTLSPELIKTSMDPYFVVWWEF